MLFRLDKLKQSIVYIAIVIKYYDEVIDFYVNKIELIEDAYQPEQDKLWMDFFSVVRMI